MSRDSLAQEPKLITLLVPLPPIRVAERREERREAQHEFAPERSRRVDSATSREIEEHLEYPGQIKVTVIRESRAGEFAK